MNIVKVRRAGHVDESVIRLADDRLMAFAGLWEAWQPPVGDELHTVTILTTDANLKKPDRFLAREDQTLRDLPFDAETLDEEH